MRKEWLIPHQKKNTKVNKILTGQNQIGKKIVERENHENEIIMKGKDEERRYA